MTKKEGKFLMALAFMIRHPGQHPKNCCISVNDTYWPFVEEQMADCFDDGVEIKKESFNKIVDLVKVAPPTTGVVVTPGSAERQTVTLPVQGKKKGPRGKETRP